MRDALARGLAAQSAVLAPFRERLLRRVGLAARGATLDLACGAGALAADLAGRVRGPVVALDRELHAGGALGAGRAVAADAAELPFAGGRFDLVVTQAAWLWFARPVDVARECARVLAPGGALVSCGEPDLGGAIEEPPESALAPSWRAALERAGADPRAGRRVGTWLRAGGFARVDVEVFGRVAPPEEAARRRESELDLLRTLPGVDADALPSAPRDAADLLAFVPWFGAVAWR